ncbi:ABC transporter permease [Caenimonas soli]|uniref:ABC transporter permease n=1 Tax=Caenimonas soli TaxID=2735555 RepID=UPI0015580A82|nr:ABC transporter permease [Caenimonas soli]NPC57185.1 ABC transporter permease [Caenimonas soli]
MNTRRTDVPEGSRRPQLSDAWRIQRAVLHALLMREILTRYGRRNIGFLWLFIEPMLFTLGVTAIWNYTKLLHGSDLPIAAFAITGYSSVLLWRNCANRCSTAVNPNLGLMYHRNVRPIDVFLARIILEIAGATATATFLTILFAATGFMELPHDLGLAVVGWLFLAWLGGAIGLVVGCFSEHSDVADRLWHAFAYLFFPFSGAVYMVSWLPEGTQELALLIPTVHAIEMLRAGYFGQDVVAHYSPLYLLASCLLLTLTGFNMVAKLSRRLEFE